MMRDQASASNSFFCFTEKLPGYTIDAVQEGRMSVPLRITVTRKAKCVYSVTLHGSINAETHQQLADKVHELIDERTKAIVFDMAGVAYISSIGISVILMTQKASKKVGVSFGMVNLQPQIKKVLDVIKIMPMVNIFDDMPEADKYIDQIIKEETARQE